MPTTESALDSLGIRSEMAADLLVDLDKYINGPDEAYRQEVIIPAQQLEVPEGYVHWVGAARSPHTEMEIQQRAYQALGYKVMFTSSYDPECDWIPYLDTYADPEELTERLFKVSEFLGTSSIYALIGRATDGCLSVDEYYELRQDKGIGVEEEARLRLVDEAFMLSTLLAWHDPCLDEPGYDEWMRDILYMYRAIKKSGLAPLGMEELIGLMIGQVQPILEAHPELAPTAKA